MAEQVADYTLKRLSEWGVKHVFGYPGDGIDGLIGALRRHDEVIEFIQARHEEMAAFMADGYAKWSGKVGVCLATSGPDAIHLLNGLYDAEKDHQPVLAIVGQQKQLSLGADYQQEVDLPVLFKDVASRFCHVCTHPSQMRQLIVLVLNNRGLNQITWEQRVMGGDPKTAATQDISDVPYDELAELFGLRGLSMKTLDDITPVWKEALAADRPVVINAYTDPEVPPLPPHIRWDQAKHYMSALIGEPNLGRLPKQSIKGVSKAFEPGQ